MTRDITQVNYREHPDMRRSLGVLCHVSHTAWVTYGPAFAHSSLQARREFVMSRCHTCGYSWCKVKVVFFNFNFSFIFACFGRFACFARFGGFVSVVSLVSVVSVVSFRPFRFVVSGFSTCLSEKRLKTGTVSRRTQ